MCPRLQRWGTLAHLSLVVGFFLCTKTSHLAATNVEPIHVYTNPEREVVPNLARSAVVTVSSYRSASNLRKEGGRRERRAKRGRGRDGRGGGGENRAKVGGEQAVDGEFGQFSRWQTERSNSPAWIELDFGQQVLFDTLRLYATHPSMASMPAFNVLVGDTPAPGKLVFSAKAALAATYNNHSLYGNALISFPRQNTRYLRIVFMTGPIMLDEIEVFDDTPPARTSVFEPGDTHIRLRQSVTPPVLAKQGDLLVWFEHGAQKVFRDDIVLATRTPEPIARVSAARGESEPFQIVLYRPQGLKNARLVVHGLTGPMKLPASSVRWYPVGYVYVRTPSEKLVSQLGRTEGLGRGWYPDYLLPAKSVDVPPGRQEPLWVVVDVPGDAVAGDYAGAMTLLADGGVSIPLELRLHVYDFAMPVPRQFKAIGRENGGIYGDMAATKAYFHQLSRIGFTGQAIFWPPPKITEASGRLQFDWTGFDEMADFCINQLHFDSLALPGDVFAYHERAFSPFNMVGRSGLTPGSPEFWASLDESLAQYGRHLQQKGWTNKFVFYLTDEPYASVQPYLIQVAAVVKKRMAGVPVLWVGGWVYPDLIGRVDIWVANAKNFETEIYRQRETAGDTVWTYSNSLWLIDTPPLGPRALGWAYAKYGVSGVFFFSLNKWAQDPYEMPLNNITRNGDPLFFYPDRSGATGQLVNSLRIEMLRDGWDDWEYIRQLRSLVRTAEGAGQGNKSAVVEARAALTEADGLVYQYGFPIVANRDQLIRQYEQDPDNNLSAAKRAKFDYVYDPDRFMAVRDRIARAIELVKGLMGLSTRTSPGSISK